MSDQLDIFGFDVSQLEEVKIDNPTTLSEVLNNIAVDMVYCLKQSVRKERLVFEGGLEESIRMPVKMFGTVMSATLYMADYYDYVNKGVRAIDVLTAYSFKPRYFFDNCMQETFYGEAFNRFKSDIRVVAGERVSKGLKEIIK